MVKNNSSSALVQKEKKFQFAKKPQKENPFQVGRGGEPERRRYEGKVYDIHNTAIIWAIHP
jgi:hypothetical protein